MSDTRAIVPEGMEKAMNDWRMAPAIASNGFLFLTGMTGRDADGTVPLDAKTQMVSAFDKVGAILAEAGCDWGDVVEMTTYHVGLRDHLALFRTVRDLYVRAPFPAWTAIDVAGFTHEDTIVEIRVIARDGTKT